MIQFCTTGRVPSAALSQRRTRSLRRFRLHTLGTLLALLLQAPGSAAPEAPNSRTLELLPHSLVAQVVLVILGIFSIVSWAIILYKLVAFRRAEKQSEQF